MLGAHGRQGDTRTHIFRINPANVDFNALFNAAGSEVLKDSAGHAAVTLDFICLRCHSGQGNAFELSINSAGEIAPNMHRTPD